MASTSRYHAHIEAFRRMLQILQEYETDVITLWDLDEGTPEYEFWTERYSDFEKNGKIYEDAGWMFAMSEDEIRHNLCVAQQAHAACASV